MSNQIEPNLAPSGESILAELGINSATVKTMKRGIKRSSYRAVINWLTKYEPNPDASNLEKVKGLLETFYTFSSIEMWEKADMILRIHTLGSTEDLYKAIGTWGAYSEQVHLFKQLLDKLNPSEISPYSMV